MDNNAPQLQKRVGTIKLDGDYAGLEFEAWLNAPTRAWMTINNPVPAITDEEVEAELGTPVAEADEGDVGAARNAIAQRNDKKLLATLQSIILSHNGWRDFDGTPFPPADTEAFYEAIPTELLATMLMMLQEAQQQYPKSRRMKKRR
jgi:hypothetical protein